eukprot:TRINITY_DN8192_c0_g1_i1.p1 TRINITY_DN8192_c0_g1~~TRINITY_DN8192_c0_g1_i1.p1  ORF type:complete len:445 (+),score=96.80 TRINITY_DN8192_c0_g1_i1:55-1389(+)
MSERPLQDVMTFVRLGTVTTSIFVQNIDISDVREAIAGRDDFREVRYSDHSVFVYFLGLAKDIFPDPNTAPDQRTKLMWQLRRECRGLVFDNEGKVIARRFHKFFNVNEQPETQQSLIDLTKPFLITEKLDGSLISPFWTEGKLRFATKQGVTDTTTFVELYVSKSSAPYVEFSESWIAKGWTPIYEYCSPDRPIVISYSEESLKLLALRNMVTGEYLDYFEMREEARKEGIPFTQAWLPEELGIDISDRNNFESFEKVVKSKQNMEGFVIRFEDGMMLKIKTNWYFDLNHSLDKIKSCSERHLWKSILEEKYDDIKSFLPNKLREATDAFSNELDDRINILVHQVIDDLKDKGEMDGRSFAEYTKTLSQQKKKIAFDVIPLFREGPKKAAPQDLPFLVRERVVAMILETLGHSKSFHSFSVPVLNDLHFRKPDWFRKDGKEAD